MMVVDAAVEVLDDVVNEAAVVDDAALLDVDEEVDGSTGSSVGSADALTAFVVSSVTELILVVDGCCCSVVTGSGFGEEAAAVVDAAARVVVGVCGVCVVEIATTAVVVGGEPVA